MALLRLRDSSLWALDQGIVATGGSIGLWRVEDRFDDGTLDTDNFGTVTAGNGTVQESHGVRIHTPGLSDGGIIYAKAPIDRTTSGSWTFCERGADNLLLSSVFLQQAPAAPVIGLASVVGNNRISDIVDTEGQLYAYRWNTSGAIRYWNEAGGVWQTTSTTIASPGVDSNLIEKKFIWEKDTAQWKWQVINSYTGNLLIDTNWVDWSDTKNNGDPYWIGCGDYLTNFWTMATIVQLIRNEYKTGPITAAMGEIDGGGAVIEQVPLVESIEQGALVSYRFNLNRSGWSGSRTLAELKADLVGETCRHLDLEITFTSDGEAGASIALGGGVLAGTGASFNMPVTTLEHPHMEVIEL